jgi:hypothetical protein
VTTTQRHPYIPRKEWYPQQRAERSAFSEIITVFLQCIRCLLCDIWIGPGHYEQEIYLYSARNEQILCYIDHHESMYTIAETPLLIPCCGTCAQRRLSSQPIRVFGPEHWTTTLLLPHLPLHTATVEEVPLLVEEARLLLALYTSRIWHFLVFLFRLHIPWAWVFCSTPHPPTNKYSLSPPAVLRCIAHPEVS